MLGIAENYERLAEHAERRSKRNNSRTIKLIHYRQAAARRSQFIVHSHPARKAHRACAPGNT